MKLRIDFALKIRNRAWMRPSTPPITNADEADGICLLSCSNSIFFVLFTVLDGELCIESVKNHQESKTCFKYWEYSRSRGKKT